MGARVAIILFTVAVAIGYTFSFSQMLARLGIPGKLAMMLGACALAYFIMATAALATTRLRRVISVNGLFRALLLDGVMERVPPYL